MVNSRLCETARPMFENSRPRLQKNQDSETQNQNKTRLRDSPCITFRDRAKIFRAPRFSRNHSIPLVYQTLKARKNSEKRVRLTSLQKAQLQSVLIFFTEFAIPAFLPSSITSFHFLVTSNVLSLFLLFLSL